MMIPRPNPGAPHGLPETRLGTSMHCTEEGLPEPKSLLCDLQLSEEPVLRKTQTDQWALGSPAEGAGCSPGASGVRLCLPPPEHRSQSLGGAEGKQRLQEDGMGTLRLVTCQTCIFIGLGGAGSRKESQTHP